ncbi:MAG: hypothetical protein ACRC0C_16910 [Gibbsiella quercinecans]|uniref:hypothetical protein n=1 Tax=Gibbsiella quercinecans TaxID=929813 RepID=UPI003F3B7681
MKQNGRFMLLLLTDLYNVIQRIKISQCKKKTVKKPRPMSGNVKTAQSLPGSPVAV